MFCLHQRIPFVAFGRVIHLLQVVLSLEKRKIKQRNDYISQKMQRYFMQFV